MSRPLFWGGNAIERPTLQKKPWFLCVGHQNCQPLDPPSPTTSSKSSEGRVEQNNSSSPILIILHNKVFFLFCLLAFKRVLFCLPLLQVFPLFFCLFFFSESLPLSLSHSFVLSRFLSRFRSGLYLIRMYPFDKRTASPRMCVQQMVQDAPARAKAAIGLASSTSAAVREGMLLSWIQHESVQFKGERSRQENIFETK